MDATASDYLVEFFKKVKEAGIEIPKPLEAFDAFLKKHKISDISNGLAVKEIALQTKAVENRKSVYLVHGWRGGKDSFGELPYFIKCETGLDVKVFSYKTSTVGKNPSISFIARNFDNWIRNNTMSGIRNIALVGHSMGGLVIRKMIAAQLYRDNPIDEIVRQITFIASPLGGAWLAKAFNFVKNIAPYQAVEMDPASSAMSDIVSEWNAWKKYRRSDIIPIRSILGTEDKYVDAASAIGDDDNPVIILGADHKSIVTPQSASDEVVQTLIRFFREAGLAA